MTAIVIRESGGPEVLTPQDVPIPEIAPDQVLIRVAAAGVNRPDVQQRKGLYPPPPGAPADIPGLEVSGEIVAVGSAAAQVGSEGMHISIGSHVCALVAGGGYAEYVAAPALQCLPLPRGVALDEGAGIPETFFTVYLNVFQRAGLQKGETLLVHGGSSGIGTTAIMLGKAIGAEVIVTAGSDEKCRACLELGADHAINYREEDFVPAVLKATNGKGANVTLDMVGGDYIARDIAASAVEGRISVIATLGGAKAEIDLRQLMAKRSRLTGSLLRPQTVEAKGRIAHALRERVWPLFASHRLRPLVHARFALREASKAHALMESNTHIGKILLLTQ
jgi:putative PIG3 family NAD(P)H quinone oxidoreductase